MHSDEDNLDEFFRIIGWPLLVVLLIVLLLRVGIIHSFVDDSAWCRVVFHFLYSLFQ